MNELKRLLFILLIIPTMTFAQSAYQDVREGNDLFRSNDYTGAESSYREGVRKDGDVVESAYNLGNALYRQGKFEDAGRYFMQAANKTEDKNKKADAYHNLGNSLIKAQKLEEGIKAYKNALINNPKDEESRYNLAYAMQQLKQQQQQQQEQQQDENKEENQEEQDNQDQQNQEQEEENKEEEQQQDQEQEQQDQQQEEQQQQQQKEEQVSREDAERILEALNNKEKELQEKLKKQKVKQVNVKIEKDW